MKIFILEKNSEDRNALKRIVQTNNLGLLVGEAHNPSEGLEEIIDLEPNLVLLDFINERLDGFRIIKEVKRKHIRTKFIIISNPTSKEIVENAYRYGVEYFIYKPINDYEVESIIKKVKYRIELEEKAYKIRQLFDDIAPFSIEISKTSDREQDINLILLKLGIMGENGSEDLLRVIKYIIDNKININYLSIRDICSKFTTNPRAMEQKMRRAINVAMTNIASLGIEDYMNETFVEYSNTLFNFEQIKREMDYIRGKSYEKGSINMKKFISGVCTLCESFNN